MGKSSDDRSDATGDEHAQLISELSGARAGGGQSAWNTLTRLWDEWEASVRQAGLVAALGSQDAWVASAARRFLTDRWSDLSALLHSASLDALSVALANPTTAPALWGFLTNHWQRCDGSFQALLDPKVLGNALDTPPLAGDAWEFLTNHWESLTDPVKHTVNTDRLRAALDGANRHATLAAWDFVIESWPALSQQLRGVLDSERIDEATRNPLVASAAAEFLEAHADVQE